MQCLLSSVRAVAGRAMATGSEDKSAWQKPVTSPPPPVLKVYNSLTKTKVIASSISIRVSGGGKLI